MPVLTKIVFTDLALYQLLPQRLRTGALASLRLLAFSRFSRSLGLVAS
jgi:hypothetical protein